MREITRREPEPEPEPEPEKNKNRKREVTTRRSGGAQFDHGRLSPRLTRRLRRNGHRRLRISMAEAEAERRQLRSRRCLFLTVSTQAIGRWQCFWTFKLRIHWR